MKVVVTKAGYDSYWYLKHIGEQFEVVPRYNATTMIKDYRVISDVGVGCLIFSDDCEEVLELAQSATETNEQPSEAVAEGELN